MKNSFIYMFKDQCFWQKYLSVFGIIFVANLLINWSGVFAPDLNEGNTSIWFYILFFTGLIVLFVPYGYSISLLKAKLDDASLSELPSINLVNNFISGFKVMLSGILLIVSLVLFIFALFLFNSFLVKFLGGFISAILNVILFLILFIIAFLFISMCCRYVVKPSFLNFLNFKAAAQLVNCNVLKYFKSFLMVVLCTVIIYSITMLSASVLTIIGYTGLVIYCMFVSILWAYQLFLYAGLFSNAVISEKI